MTREERLELLKQIEKDIHVCSLESTFLDDAKSCAIHSIIEALEQEPCEDAISRKAVQDYIAKYLSQYLYNDVRETAELIDEYIGELPSVKPQESKTGHWINIDDIKSECSECGHREPNERFIFEDINFCAKCGARMESEGDEE